MAFWRFSCQDLGKEISLRRPWFQVVRPLSGERGPDGGVFLLGWMLNLYSVPYDEPIVCSL